MNDFKALSEEAAEFFIVQYGDVTCPAVFARTFLSDILNTLNMNLSELSRKTGVSQQVLSNIRCGKSKRFTFAVFIKLYEFHKEHIQNKKPPPSK